MSETVRPQRIGLVAPYFPRQIGGANIYCYELKATASKESDVSAPAKCTRLQPPGVDHARYGGFAEGLALISRSRASR